MKKVIVAIDPGVPKKRDISATTGVFIGEISRTKRIAGFSLEIFSNEITEGIRRVAHQICNIVNNLPDAVIVLEEYVNYDFNPAANSYSKNETSQLIGAIKAMSNVPVIMQRTLDIKTGYNDNALVSRGLLEKEGRVYKYPDKLYTDPGCLEDGTCSQEYLKVKELLPDGVDKFTRHERDAFRHYLLYRKKNGYINRIPRRR